METPWGKAAGEALSYLVSTGEPFTSDDLLAQIGPPDIAHKPNAKNNSVGSVFAKAHRDGRITVVGHAQSKSPHRKGGLVRVWKGTVD